VSNLKHCMFPNGVTEIYYALAFALEYLKLNLYAAVSSLGQILKRQNIQ